MKEYKKERNEEQEKYDQRSDRTDSIGLDQDEQEMNGDYGMPETEYEDKQHKK
ncbi:DUF4021 domain-containing protein [Alkalicoccobacillus murimartini]|uniref:DUF4025 domain-containing protein n=1 Tax=Alkalicoccobacillus murimartini TaxID=171685 RepID=A0ABT9YJ23_9BACI|nr:DUF4021 domain-containing protein [Alkalicoccobacillus murimartini]MDQ0207598.1 hypothetical protein [Alkalicoccobacillus murimartini]